MFNIFNLVVRGEIESPSVDYQSTVLPLNYRTIETTEPCVSLSGTPREIRTPICGFGDRHTSHCTSGAFNLVGEEGLEPPSCANLALNRV